MGSVLTHLFAKIRNGLWRDRQLSAAERLRKGARLLAETAAARLHLCACDEVGAGARVAGKPRVINRGRIGIGKDLVVSSTFSPVELVAGPGAELSIGDGVWTNFGGSVPASRRIRIGDRSQIGQHSVVADAELPGGEDARPVVIGSDVWIAGRVTVLPGSSIGDGSVITAGSIVS